MIACLGLLALACAEQDAPAGGGKTSSAAEGAFVDVSKEAGLAGVEHFAGFTPYRFLVETMGGGVGWLDYDVDGWPDLYFVQSAPLEGGDAPSQAPRNQLFRNVEGHFTERTEEARVGDPGFGIGCAVGDVEGDGDPDLYVANFGSNVLYRNRGDGGFDDHSRASGTDDGGWGVSAGFFDADRDGDLDLYLVNYVYFTLELQRSKFTMNEGGKSEAYPHPDLFEGEADRYYRNEGNGSFSSVASEVGLAPLVPGKGLGVTFCDVERDGDVDVYVANDSTPNFLFVNDGSGSFEDIGPIAGCAFNLDGQTEASMGVDFGDADGDGLADLFVSHLDLETNTYYGNRSKDGVVAFRDLTRRAGLAQPSVRLTGFGTIFLDFDADSDLDLFLTNGHIIDNVEEIYTDRTYPQVDHLYENDGTGRFALLGESAGAYFGRRLVGRGAATSDFDRDGDTDLVVFNSGGPAVLLRNEADAARWVRFRLQGASKSPRDGTGALLTLRCGERVQVRELFTARSYASACDSDVFFGLGDAESIDALEVRWPSGAEQGFAPMATNAHYLLVEGESAPRPLGADR